MRRGRYYIGRVIKLGMLDQEKLMNAIAKAPTITIGKHAWTITDVEDSRNSNMPYLFGNLSKFAFEGHVTVIDTATRSKVEALAPNLLVASSPFVYLPNFSGIAYMHAWNGIQEELFPRRFKNIIEAAYGNFFVDCSIEPVSDYKAFSSKLQELDKFTEISAKVYPPNPLFGRLWGSLNDYIKERNASEVSIKESSEEGQGLKTKIVSLIVNILKDEKFEPETPLAITDAAILMAADGYGKGFVAGEHDGAQVVIRTSETQKSFLFNKAPVPEQLADEAEKHFRRISKERDMRH